MFFLSISYVYCCSLLILNGMTMIVHLCDLFYIFHKCSVKMNLQCCFMYFTPYTSYFNIVHLYVVCNEEHPLGPFFKTLLQSSHRTLFGTSTLFMFSPIVISTGAFSSFRDKLFSNQNNLNLFFIDMSSSLTSVCLVFLI